MPNENWDIEDAGFDPEVFYVEPLAPPRPWWPGDKRVEPYMGPVAETIKKHLPWPSPAFTEIYNRAYDAVFQAIKDRDEPENEVSE